MLPFTNNC